jgi:hypothetical protein
LNRPRRLTVSSRIRRCSGRVSGLMWGAPDVGLPGPPGLRLEDPQCGRRISGGLPDPGRSRGRYLQVIRARRLPSREEDDPIEIRVPARGERTAGCHVDSEHVASVRMGADGVGSRGVCDSRPGRGVPPASRLPVVTGRGDLSYRRRPGWARCSRR